MCHYPVRASESKYGKFAYSSAFGYSVPTGGYFVEAVGHDSMIAVTEDEEGMGEVWRVRRVATDARIEQRPLDEAAEGEEKTGPVLISGWQPFPDVSIDTYLIPPTEEAPNWHLRVHRIQAGRDIRTSEGAFALHGTRKSDGRELAALSMSGDERGQTSPEALASANEGVHAKEGEALAVTSAGAVGIAELLTPSSSASSASSSSSASAQRQGKVLAMDANSNLIAKRSVMPSLAAEVKKGEVRWWVTGVFAVPESVEGWEGMWREGWERRPKVPGWVREMVEKDERER